MRTFFFSFSFLLHFSPPDFISPNILMNYPNGPRVLNFLILAETGPGTGFLGSHFFSDYDVNDDFLSKLYRIVPKISFQSHILDVNGV